jgi:hypothetical protein
MVRRRLCGLGLAALLFGGAVSTAAAQEASTVVTYDQVRAVFKKRCLTCHDADRARGDLDLSSVASIKAGSSSGPVVVSGKADESLVYTLAAHLEDPKMPPGTARIPARELDLIRGWIEGGLQERVAGGNAPAEKVATSTAAKPAATTRPPVSVGEKGLAVESLSGRTAVTALAAGPTGDVIAISGRRQIVLLQGKDLKPIRTFAFPEGDVFVLKFSADGRLLLAGGGIGGESGKVIGFDVDSGNRTFEVGDENDVVLAADLSPDGKLVALGGPGKSVKLYPVAGGDPIATLKKHTDWILSVAFSPDGLLLASSDRFGGLQIWEAATGKDFFTLRGHTGAITSVNWLGASDRLLSAGEDGTLHIWDMHKGQTLRQWDAGVGAILVAAIGAKGEIAAAGRGKRIAVWTSIDEASRLISMDDEIGELAFSGAADRVIAADAMGCIGVFTQATGELAGRFELPVVKVAHVMKPRSAPVVIAKATVEVAKVPSEGQLVNAEADVARTRQELSAGREALALTESAIVPAEDSLKKLRESAVKLKVVVAGQERALNLAMERLEQARTQLAATGGAASSNLDGPNAIKASLEEKQLLLDSAAAFAKQIEDAAARSPGDHGLQAALKLAVELKARLEADVELATKPLKNPDSRQPVEEVAGNG